jgi:hypothetical protein
MRKPRDKGGHVMVLLVPCMAALSEQFCVRTIGTNVDGPNTYVDGLASYFRVFFRSRKEATTIANGTVSI